MIHDIRFFGLSCVTTAKVILKVISCPPAAIRCVMDKQNTLLVMPTGGGKTGCYVVPALMENKIAVVFPLLALLLDQAERMRSHGLSVCYLMTDMEENERKNVTHQLNATLPENNFLLLPLNLY